MKNKNNIEVNILVGSNSVPEYVKNDSVFIEGKENSEYSIKVKNHNGYRVKCVLGVDGLNIVDSNLIGDSKDEIGYILDPYQETIIKGYRIDEKSVSSFKFVAKNAAYANTDKGQEGKTTGVISVKVYREKIDKFEALNLKLAKLSKDLEDEKFKWPKYVPIYPKFIPLHNPWYNQYWEYPYNNPFFTSNITWTCTGTSTKTETTYAANTMRCCATNAEDNPNNMGTATSVNYSQHLDNKSVCDNQAVEPRQDSPFVLGSSWGSKVESNIKEVAFETGDYFGESIIYYTDRAGLEVLGIEFKKVPKISIFPNPAPASKKYCAVPSGWNG